MILWILLQSLYNFVTLGKLCSQHASIFNYKYYKINIHYSLYGGEGWLGFPDLWSGQKPWWNWYLTPVVNFGKVQRAQLAKSTLLTSMLVPLGSFKVCLDAKEGVGCRMQREATTPIQSLVKLQPWFLSLRWKMCLRQNCSLGSCACSKDLPLGRTLWWWWIESA